MYIDYIHQIEQQFFSEECLALKMQADFNFNQQVYVFFHIFSLGSVCCYFRIGIVFRLLLLKSKKV